MLGSETIICPHCQAVNPAAARFCMQCGGALPPTPGDDARLSRLVAATPAPLAAKVRAADHLSGERRLVTALLVDVVNARELAATLGEDLWTATMNRALDRFSPTIYRYEGTITRLMGDTLLAFFGAPLAHEDDPLRAVHAALDLIAEAHAYADELRCEHGITFAVQITVSSGPVVIGPVGSNLTYDYTDSGDAVTLTALMQAAALPMTVLISEYTYRFVAPFFDCSACDVIPVRGKAQPVQIYHVRMLRPEPTRARGLAGLVSPLVGRSAELAVLRQLGATLQAGLGRVAVVLGEPGLGKSRLVAEWRATMQRMSDGKPSAVQWAEGHCLSYGQDLAYHLLIDVLRSLLGVPKTAGEAETRAALLTLTGELFGAESRGVYAMLGHLLSLRLEEDALDQVRSLDPQTLRTQYLVALRELLRALAQRRPLVLVLEDMHWSDPSSTELLIRLLPLANELPLFYCIISRSDRDAPGWRLITAAREMLGGGLTEVTLSALSDDESQQLVANLLEIEALPPQVRALILTRADGNPFFVEEVIRMLIDRGAIIRQGERWVVGAEIDRIDIPDNLQSLLLARIDRLPNEVRHTLRIAAVIGRQFPLKVLERVLQKEAAGEPANAAPHP